MTCLHSLLAVAITALQAAGSPQGERVELFGPPVKNGPVLYQERPDDPPAEPAPVDPQAPPAEPVTRGGFASVQVNVSPGGANVPGDAANEPSIAVDPTNPLRMAIGWRQFDNISSNFRQAGLAFSVDGGRTWTNNGPLEPGVFRSDPVLDFDAEGVFYYDSLDGSAAAVQVFRSTDQGATWGSPVPAFGGDKNWIAIDRTSGVGAKNLYQTWSVYFGCCGSDTFTRSSDGAQTFTSPVPVSGAPVFGTAAVGADGTVYVAGADSTDFGNFRVARSSDAQNPNVTSPSFSFADVDLGGAMTLSVGPNPGGLLGQADVAVDVSNGPHAGNVYLLCSVDPPGADPMDVMFSRSLDGGATWSAPTKVNVEPATTAWQWFGTLSVAPNGRLDVVFNETPDTGQQNMTELVYTSSSDGGLTWSPQQVLSPVFDSHLGWPNQSKIGDYSDMRSDLVGADLAWAATFTGGQDVYHLRIGEHDCNQNGVGDETEIAAGALDVNSNGILDDCECLSQTYCVGAPNSAGAGASIGFTGSLSISQNDLVLTASGCPPGKQGVFFYGLNQTQLPFGDGFRCILAPTFRLGPLVTSDGSGNVARPLDFTAPPASAGNGAIAPLAAWNFQFWYRDLPAGNTGTNLSDAIELTFCP